MAAHPSTAFTRKPKSGKRKSIVVHPSVFANAPSLGSRPGYTLFQCPVKAAVDMLLNNGTCATETKGTMSTSRMVFPAELVLAARGMFPAGKVYNFEIHASGTTASTAGGVVNTRASWDPSVTTFAEWTALAALFDECNSNHIQIDITSAFGPTSTAIIAQVMVGPDRDGVSGATPSYTTCQRLAESEPFHLYNMAVSPGRFTKRHNIHRTRPWAVTSAPGGASGTPSGLIGQFSMATNIVTTPSINVFFWALKHNVALRNRA